jgi:hypothetical protein
MEDAIKAGHVGDPSGGLEGEPARDGLVSLGANLSTDQRRKLSFLRF